MQTTMKTIQAAPKIWKKFSDQEKELWSKFYQRFLVKNNYPDDGKYITDKDIHVIAYNLACQAIWSMQGK